MSSQLTKPDHERQRALEAARPLARTILADHDCEPGEHEMAAQNIADLLCEAERCGRVVGLCEAAEEAKQETSGHAWDDPVSTAIRSLRLRLSKRADALVEWKSQAHAVRCSTGDALEAEGKGER